MLSRLQCLWLRSPTCKLWLLTPLAVLCLPLGPVQARWASVLEPANTAVILIYVILACEMRWGTQASLMPEGCLSASFCLVFALCSSDLLCRAAGPEETVITSYGHAVHLLHKAGEHLGLSWHQTLCKLRAVSPSDAACLLTARAMPAGHWVHAGEPLVWAMVQGPAKGHVRAQGRAGILDLPRVLLTWSKVQQCRLLMQITQMVCLRL